MGKDHNNNLRLDSSSHNYIRETQSFKCCGAHRRARSGTEWEVRERSSEGTSLTEAGRTVYKKKQRQGIKGRESFRNEIRAKQKITRKGKDRATQDESRNKNKRRNLAPFGLKSEGQTSGRQVRDFRIAWGPALDGTLLYRAARPRRPATDGYRATSVCHSDNSGRAPGKCREKGGAGCVSGKYLTWTIQVVL